MQENHPPDHLAGAKTSEKGARASRAPLFVVFWHLPSGLAAAFPPFRAAMLRVRIANFRARIPARWTDRPFDRQNGHLGILQICPFQNHVKLPDQFFYIFSKK